MEICMTPRYLMMTTGLVAMAGALAPAGAEAQSRCGASTTIGAGDTLYSISQTCRVALSQIYDRNPDLNPRDLQVGTTISLTGDAGDTAGGPPEPVDDSYEVQPGDNPYTVAQSLGITVTELLAENEDLEPFAMAVGEMLDVPDGTERSPGFRVRPLAGPVGSEVSVRAQNLRPNDVVTIGVGPTSSEWTPLRDARVAADGEVTTEVTVPDWTEPGDILTFVVDTDRGVTLKSRDFDVVRAEAEDPGEEGIALEGRVAQGVECYTLTTADGDLWSLTSDDIRFTSGEYVEVEGTRAEASFCMQGIGTVAVEDIEEVRAPG